MKYLAILLLSCLCAKAQYWALDFDTMWASASSRGTVIQPLVHYKLDGNALDSSGNGYDGTVTGATVTNGVYGQAYWFGADASITYNAGNLISNHAKGTVAFWVRRTSADIRILYMVRRDGNNFHFVVHNADGTIGTRLYEGSERFFLASASAIDVDVWAHVAVRWGVDGWKIAVDGIAQSVNANTTAITLVDPSALWLGNNAGAVASLSTMDDVRIYNRALSIDNINAIRLNQNATEELQ